MTTQANRYQAMNPIFRLGIEMGPLLVFFGVNASYGIFAATGVFMIAVVTSLGVAYVAARHIPTVPLVSGVIVMVFGGLTLYLQDETFIKLKPTIVNGLFAAAIFGGLWFGKNYVKTLLGTMVALTDEGWRRLAVRWGVFFIATAILNEIVWRNFSTDAWVIVQGFRLSAADRHLRARADTPHASVCGWRRCNIEQIAFNWITIVIQFRRVNLLYPFRWEQIAFNWITIVIQFRRVNLLYPFRWEQIAFNLL